MLLGFECPPLKVRLFCESDHAGGRSDLLPAIQAEAPQSRRKHQRRRLQLQLLPEEDSPLRRCESGTERTPTHVSVTCLLLLDALSLSPQACMSSACVQQRCSLTSSSCRPGTTLRSSSPSVNPTTLWLACHVIKTPTSLKISALDTTSTPSWLPGAHSSSCMRYCCVVCHS